MNFHNFKLDLEKAEGPEFKLPTSIESSKKQESSRETSTSALLTIPKPLAVWITVNCGKFLKKWEYETTWPASWKICHPACLTYMQSASCKMLGWIKRKLESRLPGEISITSDVQICRWYHSYGRNQRRTKGPLHTSEKREWKKLA